MPVNFITSFEVRVAGGPTFSSSQTQPVEAYDVLDVVVAAGASDLEVELPGGSGQVQFFYVGATRYIPSLSYKIDKDSNPSHDLDRPLVLAGAGAVGLLGTSPPSKLLFSNVTDQDMTVQILVGRDATP